MGKHRCKVRSEDDLLRVRDYSVFLRRKQYLGILSVLGVLTMRDGRRINNLFEVLEGLSLLAESYLYEPNPHRLATLAGWTIGAAMSSKFRATFEMKLLGIESGLVQLAGVGRDNRNATLSSLKQMWRERKH